jgi:hypothetical protein
LLAGSNGAALIGPLKVKYSTASAKVGSGPVPL